MYLCSMLVSESLRLVTGTNRTTAEQAAGAQVHRQRMGAFMGPTACAKLFKLHDDTTGGREPLRFLKALAEKLGPLEKAVPKFKATPEAAEKHIEGYKVWLSTFIHECGLRVENGYCELHILRKHIIVQTILAQQGRLPKGTSDMDFTRKCLAEFSCKTWFPHSQSIAALQRLVPDQGEYLSTFAGWMRPWHLLHS